MIKSGMKRKMNLKKSRAHYVLFQKDTPFKPKVVKNKRAYTRKIKYREDFLS